MFDGKQLKIVIGWIPSHVGIMGNDTVDLLAKEATGEDRDNRIKVPKSDWKAVFKEDIRLRTRDKLEAEGKYKGRKYFNQYYDRNKRQPWFKKVNVPRGLGTLINRLRANHYNLNESLARKNYIWNDRCDCGMEEQNIYHIAFRCINFDNQREGLYKRLEKLNIVYPYNLDEWLKNVILDPMEAVWRFLQECGLII